MVYTDYIISYFIISTADFLNIKNIFIFEACYNNNLEIVEYLIDKGANINEKANNCSTALMMGINNYFEFIRILFCLVFI